MPLPGALPKYFHRCQNVQSHPYATYLVFESALFLLLDVCFYCRSACITARKTVIGSFLRVTQSCKNCAKSFTWESQPIHQKTPLGSLLTSAAILYSGSLPAKALRIFHILKCPTICTKTYFRHQQRHLQPANIGMVWKQQQKELLSRLKKEKFWEEMAELTALDTLRSMGRTLW